MIESALAYHPMLALQVGRRISDFWNSISSTTIALGSVLDFVLLDCQVLDLVRHCSYLMETGRIPMSMMMSFLFA